MTVYVDPLKQYASGIWCHMVANDLEELHKMAQTIGLSRRYFQNHPRHPHYDLRSAKRVLAVQHGAVEVSSKELLRRIS